MELFTELVNLLAVVGIIGGLVLGAWFVISLYWVHGRQDEREHREIELPGNIHEVFTGIPPALWIFYIVFFIISIVHVTYVWLGGINY